MKYEIEDIVLKVGLCVSWLAIVNVFVYLSLYIWGIV